MEKARIVKYALMQIVALIYGILFSAATVKLNKPLAEEGYTMPDAYYRAVFFRDYGAWLLIIVILWTMAVAYLSSPLSRLQIDEAMLTVSSLGVAILFGIAGTIIAFGGMMPPLVHMTPLP